MSDRRARLEALAQKRRNEDTSPSHSNKKSKLSSERSPASKPKTSEKPNAPKKRVIRKSFIAESDDEDDEDEDEEEDDGDDESEQASSEDERPRKKSTSSNRSGSNKKGKTPAKKPVKKLASKKRRDDDDEGSGGDDDKSDISEDELEGLDTSVIISGGRRTRGKKIDYKQFGADPEGEDE